MKKILIVLLSLVVFIGLISVASGCEPQEGALIIDPTVWKGIPDPDLSDDQIKDFDNAWDAFTYAKNRFENVEEDYVACMLGKSETTDTFLSLGNGSQTLYNEKYKSSETNNFYFNTNCYGSNIMGIDPCVSLKVYKLNNSNSYQAHINYGRYSSTNIYGTKADSNKIVADFAGVNYESFDNPAKFLEKFGSDPTKLSVYVIDQSTIEDIKDFQKLSDGSYKFTFDFNEGVHVNYKTQVKTFSKQNYGGWNSTSLTFTIDKYGRIKKLEGKDVYTMDVFGGATVTATTAEYFYYGYIPNMTFTNGNIVTELKSKK